MKALKAAIAVKESPENKPWLEERLLWFELAVQYELQHDAKLAERCFTKSGLARLPLPQSLALSLSLSLSLALSLSRTRSHSLSLSRSLAHTLARALSLSLLLSRSPRVALQPHPAPPFMQPTAMGNRLLA